LWDNGGFALQGVDLGRILVTKDDKAFLPATDQGFIDLGSFWDIGGHLPEQDPRCIDFLPGPAEGLNYLLRILPAIESEDLHCQREILGDSLMVQALLDLLFVHFPILHLEGVDGGKEKHLGVLIPWGYSSPPGPRRHSSGIDEPPHKRIFPYASQKGRQNPKKGDHFLFRRKSKGSPQAKHGHI
jgi:hypothetical protein